MKIIHMPSMSMHFALATSRMNAKAVGNPTKTQPETGKVFIAKALASHQLTTLGFTEPTTEELESALHGGTVVRESDATGSPTELSGVLILREQKMGWGKIARELDMKLGAAVSAYKAAADSLAPEEIDSGTNEETTARRNPPTRSRMRSKSFHRPYLKSSAKRLSMSRNKANLSSPE